MKAECKSILMICMFLLFDYGYGKKKSIFVKFLRMRNMCRIII